MLDIFKGMLIVGAFDHLIFEVGKLWGILEQITKNKFDYEIIDL